MPSVYEIVTQQVINLLECGVVPWKRPFLTHTPANLVSGKEYRGINTFLLGCQHAPSRFWLTYKQVAQLGGNVKQGERSSLVVFWSVGKEKLNPKTGRVSKPFLLRYYNVFNLCQTENVQHKLASAECANPVVSIPECERIVADMPHAPKIIEASRAYYAPTSDTVGIPMRSNFTKSEEYYATLFHELTHATGHPSRIGREGFTAEIQPFGSESYSREELIAEMGASMLCGVAGISPVVIENSAAYLASWLKVLKGDSKLIVSAASAAQKAADYIRGISFAERNAESVATE